MIRFFLNRFSPFWESVIGGLMNRIWKGGESDGE